MDHYLRRVLDRATDYIERARMAESYFGVRVANNARLLGRYRDRLATLERDAARIEAFMDEAAKAGSQEAGER